MAEDNSDVEKELLIDEPDPTSDDMSPNESFMSLL
jgi:hypothetical protein